MRSPRLRNLALAILALAITALSARADATLVFNEIMYHPATNEPAMEWVELYNQLAVDLDVSGWSLDGEITYTFPPNTRVKGRGLVVVAINPEALLAAQGITNVLGPFAKRLGNNGGTLLLRNNNGRIMDQVNYGTEGEWPVAPDGAGPALAKIDEETASAPPANWTASPRLGGTPGVANTMRVTTTTLARTLVPLNHSWRYDQSAADLGTAWREPDYDDSGWAFGPGVFGVENNATVSPLINTPLALTSPSSQRVLTYYFRTHFTFTNNPAQYFLIASNLIDDGVVVYLNGAEIYRYRVATNQNYQSLAENQGAEGVFEAITLLPTHLRPGDNVLAAEVHQVNNTSSDVVFGLSLADAVTITNLPPDVGTPLPVALNEISAVTNATLWVELYNGGGEPVALENCVLARFGTYYEEYAVPAQILPAGGRLVLDRAQLGFGADPGDRVVLYGPGKSNVLDALVAKRYPRTRWPEGTGAWFVAEILTPGTTNRITLNDAVVINEILFQHKSFPGTNGLPAQPNPEEWIELYNRSTQTVDLTGWTLSGGVAYAFPPGQTLAPGAFLVVAKDAAALRAAYPGIQILGDYGGRLSSKGEHLRLLDALGNPVDEVRFYSGGRWAEHAGGGGSSLELRDPHADNRRAEAWSASDESGKSTWQTYSYRKVAQASLGANSDSYWRDFLLGLNAAGECLIDDIRVVQSPTNNPVQLIGNGDFENGLTGWRVLGNHGASEVISEPGNPGNHVLRIVATGPQEHMNNHIETTLINGLSVANGQLYEISYRAKWITGHSRLNTRLWFNRAARSTDLEVPQRNGTPGARNSRYEPNIGPTFARLQHEPVVPPAGAPVTVSVQVQDPQGVTNCQVFWSVAGGAFSNAPMVRQGNDVYTSTIPGFPASTIVQFYVRAVDALGAAATFPAGAAQGGALYIVNDGQASLGLAHNIRIITTPANAALLHADTNVMSNDELPCTVIYNECVAYYNVGVRLKASMNGRPYSARVGFHLAFQPDELFRGVHPTMGLDRRSGDSSPANEEIVVRHIALVAGGIPTMHLDVARVLSPRGTENGPALLTPSYEDEFAETAFTDGGEGLLFEMEGPYVATTANAAGYKLPQPNNSGNYVDVADHGDDPEVYRYHYIRKNQRTADDFAPLIGLSKAFSLSGAALEQQTRQLMDMEEWLRAYAVITLCGVNDTYTFWLNHNMIFYFRPADHKAVYLMWDNDFTFARSATDVIVGGQNLGRIINLPANLRALYAHLLDLMNTTYNTNYLAYWLAHYGPYSGATYSRLSYIQQRSDYVKSVIAGAGGNTPFSVAATNLSVTGSNVVTLSGSAPVTVRILTVNGVAWPVVWNSLSSWTLRLPLSAATNTLVIAGLDLRGNLVSNTSFTATAVVHTPTESPVGQIVFNEIMFHADVPGAEYIELFNRSTNTTFNLSGWRVNGLDYTFPSGSYLSPRAHLVLAKNRAQFTATFGQSAALFDEFKGEFQRDGETISLIQTSASPAADVVVDRIRYESDLPWPAPAASGTGSSYQLVDLAQDNRRAGNWTAQYTPAVYEGGITIPARTNAGWVPVTLTGSIGAGIGGGQQRLLIYLGQTNGASAIIDDLCLVEGTNAEVGFNYIHNADFEIEPLRDDPWLTNSWLVPTNYTNSTIMGGLAFSGSRALRIECTTFGNSYGRIISQNLSPAPAPNTICTLSFKFWATNSATNLYVRIQGSPALTTGTFGTNINPYIIPGTYIPPTLVSAAAVYRTPGVANSLTATIPPFPELWINELQTGHLDGVLDNQGEPDPWIEIFNAGSSTVSLDGLFLADSYTNLTRWAFPSGYSLGPGQFLVVFCDGQPAQTTANELHTNFRLPSGGGLVALSRLHNSQPQVLDYVNYRNLPSHRSYGSFPDGQPFDRQQFVYLTPATTNDGRLLYPAVLINEWMAGNARTLADPADGNYEDWFELFNPTTNAVDLSGFYLTDNLTNQFKCRISTNDAHVIPPLGYLLVWADEEAEQNQDAFGAARADLHVNFKLAAAGEAIGLFAPGGTPIDVITFGGQTNDVSQGRYPDGAAAVHFMPGAASPRAANRLGAGVAPVLVPVAQAGRSLQFNWATQPGLIYIVEARQDLRVSPWLAIWTNSFLESTAQFTISTTNAPQQYFRIRSIINPQTNKP